MILAYITHPGTAAAAVATAASLARHFQKPLAVLAFAAGRHAEPPLAEALRRLAREAQAEDARVMVREDGLEGLGELCETLEASFLVAQLTDKRARSVQRLLTACRPLRIPYLLFKDTFAPLQPTRMLVPVTFLEEEYEKAQFASAFGRFYHAHVLLLQAADYGSKAARTTGKIRTLLDKFAVDYEVERARHDSFKVEREAVRRAESEDYGLVLLSASRDYGLDDLVFGPKERGLVRRSSVPVLLINPRGDLYALCD